MQKKMLKNRKKYFTRLSWSQVEMWQRAKGTVKNSGSLQFDSLYGCRWGRIALESTGLVWIAWFLRTTTHHLFQRLGCLVQHQLIPSISNYQTYVITLKLWVSHLLRVFPFFRKYCDCLCSQYENMIRVFLSLLTGMTIVTSPFSLHPFFPPLS